MATYHRCTAKCNTDTDEGNIILVDLNHNHGTDTNCLSKQRVPPKRSRSLNSSKTPSKTPTKKPLKTPPSKTTLKNKSKTPFKTPSKAPSKTPSKTPQKSSKSARPKPMPPLPAPTLVLIKQERGDEMILL